MNCNECEVFCYAWQAPLSCREVVNFLTVWPLRWIRCMICVRNYMTAPHRWCGVHYNVIKWKHFPRYWPFVRGIRRSPVKSPHKGQWRGALIFSLICALNKRLSKQSWGCWFGTQTRSSWRLSNGHLISSTAYAIGWETLFSPRNRNTSKTHLGSR